MADVADVTDQYYRYCYEKSLPDTEILNHGSEVSINYLPYMCFLLHQDVDHNIVPSLSNLSLAATVNSFNLLI